MKPKTNEEHQSEFCRQVDLPHARTDDVRSLPIRFFTINGIADAMDVSPRTVRRWIKSGELIAHYFGAVVRIAEPDFKGFLAKRRSGVTTVLLTIFFIFFSFLQMCREYS